MTPSRKGLTKGRLWEGPRKGAYVSMKLTFPELDRLEEEEAARGNKMGVTSNEGRFSIVAVTSPEHRPLGHSKPWSSGARP